MTLTSATPTPDTRTAPRPPGDPLNLTRAELDDLAAQLDAVREDIFSQRGQSDARYIRRVVALQRGLELTGRACMIFSRHKPLWWSGVGCLSVGKILENMEIG
ncbi:fatty acid desaturase, partial [Kocuria rhizophila]